MSRSLVDGVWVKYHTNKTKTKYTHRTVHIIIQANMYEFTRIGTKQVM